MKFIIFTVAIIAFIGTLSQALPQRYHKLPYYPRPTSPPRPMRARRDTALGGQISTNPSGGNNAKLDLTHAVGTPDHNVIGQVFAAGNTARGPVTSGGTLAYNNNGLGAAISKTHTPGGTDTFTKSLNANLYNNGIHKVDANVFKSQNTHLPSGFQFERNGHGLEYSHINGHGASLTQSNIPNIGRQFEVAGKNNLWTSQDRSTRLDLTGSRSQWTSGPFSGQKNYGGNLGLTYTFG